MNDVGPPVIKPMAWVPARDVLPGEATHFTPWLAENLDLLADALGLAELTLVDTEIAAAEKRLDILAAGTDDDGTEFPVVIENQYSITDHKHLGQLVTYLAQQGRGLAVWVTEASAEAHVAAIDFLNRTSSSDVGYVLTRVRFTQGADHVYHVDFDILAKPNTFLRQSKNRKGGSATAGKVNADKKAYLKAILDIVQAPLSAAGLRHIRMHTRGAYIELRFPSSSELDGRSARLSIKTTQESCSVGLHIPGYDTREENSAVLDILHDRYEDRLAKQLPSHNIRNWHWSADSSNSDNVRIEINGYGYRTGDAADAAAWAQAVCETWAEVITSDPIVNLDQLVEDRLAHDDESETTLT